MDYRSIMKSYPQLSYEEERKLIDDNRGDEKRLRELLVYHNMAVAYRIGVNYGNSHRGDSIEDCVQRAMHGLYLASQDFNIDSNNKFMTYATWIIMREVFKPYQKTLASEILNRRTVSMDTPIGRNKEDGEFTIQNVLPSVISPDYSLGKDTNDEVSELFNCDILGLIWEVVNSMTRFNTRKQTIFYEYLYGLYIGRHVTFETIGKRYGITRERVRQIYNQMLDAFWRKLENDYSHDAEIAEMVNIYKRHKCESAFKSETYLEVTGEKQKLEEEAQEIEDARKETTPVGAIARLRERLEMDGRSSGDILANLKAKLYKEAFAKANIAETPNVYKPISDKREIPQYGTSETSHTSSVKKTNLGYGPRNGVATMRYDRLVVMGKSWEKGKTETYWMPDRVDRRLRETFAYERYLDNSRHNYLDPKSIKKLRLKSLYKKKKSEADIATVKAGATSPDTASIFSQGQQRIKEETTEQEIFEHEMESRLIREKEEQIMRGMHNDDEYEMQDAEWAV